MLCGFGGYPSSGVVIVSGETVTNIISGFAEVIFNADGTVDKNDFVGITQIDASTDWIIPNESASSTYEIRYTNLTGDALFSAPAAEDTWSDLGSNRTFAQSGNPKSSTFDIEIRLGGTSLSSASYTLTCSS